MLHQFEVGLEQGWTAITLGKRGKAAELFGELRGTVGACLLEVVNTEKAVMV
ncbi:hypothetical protein D3C84_1054080 [compost metagenome]